MPIRQPSNRRVLPSNAKVVRTAREALHRVIPTQIRKYDAAFQVNGYSGILYHRLTTGLPCACQSKSKAVHSRLDADGKASQGDINRMILGAPMGVSSYASREKDPMDGNYLEVKLGPSPAIKPKILSGGYGFQGDILEGSGLWSLDDVDELGTPRPVETIGLDRRSISSEVPAPDVVVPEAVETETAFDPFLHGYSEVSCPICFGSGFVGGFQPLGGWRKVLTFQDPGMVLPAESEINVEEAFPSITTKTASFQNVQLPFGVQYVDAFRVWNKGTIVPVGTVRCDSTVLTKEDSIGALCDGRPHTLQFEWSAPVTFTHIELQLGYTTNCANFELPKTSLSGNQSVLEATDPFQVVLSPRVPIVSPMDVLVESTLGKVLQVTSVPQWVDSARTVLGWECDVRPVQPMELFCTLPRRSPTQVFNTRTGVVDNAVLGFQPQAGNETAESIQSQPIEYIAGEDLPEFRLVALRPGNLIFLADSTDIEDIDRVIGIVTTSFLTGSVVTFQSDGAIRREGWWDWSPPETLYLGRNGLVSKLNNLSEFTVFHMTVGVGDSDTLHLNIGIGVPL